jgi:hypothetical protein
MKKPVIFVLSTSLMRGRKLASKAGFFYFSKQVSKKLAACLYRTLRRVFPRASDGVDSGIAQAAFLFAKINVNIIHHAHHTTAQASRCACKGGRRSHQKHPTAQEGYQARKAAAKAAHFRFGSAISVGSTVIPHSLHF